MSHARLLEEAFGLGAPLRSDGHHYQYQLPNLQHSTMSSSKVPNANIVRMKSVLNYTALTINQR